MLISTNYTLHQEKPDQWIISFDTGSHFAINTKVVGLIGISGRSASMQDAYNSYRTQPDTQPLEFEAFEKLATDVIDRLKLDSEKEYTKQQSYITLKLTLLPAAYIKYVTAPFVWLFSAKAFYPVLLLVLLFDLLILWQSDITLTAQYLLFNPLTLLMMIWLSTMLHEIGHLAACKKYGAKHGEIGFGFYFIFPVAYADVSGVWALPKQQRIMVNLAGVFMEIIFVAALFTLSVWLPYLKYAAALILLRVAYTMVPFLRNDGYWLLGDLFQEHNLLTTANQTLKIALKNLKTPSTAMKSGMSLKQRYLIAYAIGNISYFPMFLFFIAYSYTQVLINFPMTVAASIGQFVNSRWGLKSLTLCK
jgi:putative peptide zinc metalloprotease protein